MKTVLVTYKEFVDGGHALLDGGYTEHSKVVEVENLTDLNDEFKHITKVKTLIPCGADKNLKRLRDEVLKVWNEDGELGEIQMKTPIAWHRVLRIAQELI